MSIQEQISKLEEEQFYLDMKDIWEDSDYRQSQEIHKKIMKLKGELNGNTRNEQ